MKIVERWLVANGEVLLLENGDYVYFSPFKSLPYKIIGKEDARDMIETKKKQYAT
jgi:hypothetical protein